MWRVLYCTFFLIIFISLPGFTLIHLVVQSTNSTSLPSFVLYLHEVRYHTLRLASPRHLHTPPPRSGDSHVDGVEGVQADLEMVAIEC
ncbi:hypothetical protein DFJ43DRAFT_1068979 [Lentinula guzmanii]|uniref:Uncharacterized protein n=1 Tax=Lentinula guzmanii TaxID=2804957 RepID=A0AA38JPV2_9AGAR|nr:hypothetical protein DFJ43DRAFT_1068979 [Lentinula guzmanii]